MNGRKKQSRIFNDVNNTMDHDLIILHCLLRQENLCVKSRKMTNVITVVSKLVNFIGSKEINHSQFKDFLSDVESEHRYVLYYSLNRGRMLKRVYDLKSEAELFLEMKATAFLGCTNTTACSTFSFISTSPNI